jgi:hypothetical protein
MENSKTVEKKQQRIGNREQNLQALIPRLHIFFYAALSLLVLGPLLKPGYVFLLDYVVGPHPRFLISGDAALNSWPLFKLLYALSKIVPSWFIQKLVLFSILFTSGMSMHNMVPVKSRGARYFAGTLYMINPFVFARLQAGHIGLLLGYSITPFVVSAFLRLLKEPDLKKGIKAGLWLTILAIFSIHSLFVLLILILGIGVFGWTKRRDHAYLKRLGKGVVSLLLLFLILSAFWLIPFIFGRSPITSIDVRHIKDFETRPDGQYGVVFSVAGLHGFWHTQMFNLKKTVPVWPFLFLVILAFVVYGLISAIKDEDTRSPATVLALTAVIAIPLAVGTASWAIKDAWLWMFVHVPFFKGYREPQKFVALVAFSYSYLGAIGIDTLGRYLNGKNKTGVMRQSPTAVALLAVVAVVIYTYPMFWGLGGEIRSVDYPDSWYKANEIIKGDPSEGKTLFLPWHLYMPFRFNHVYRVVANPADQFFERQVITGDNLELEKVYTTSTDPTSQEVEGLMAKGRNGRSIGAGLIDLGVSYIVLAKDYDWRKYRWLYREKKLTKVFETSKLTLFKIRK